MHENGRYPFSCKSYYFLNQSMDLFFRINGDPLFQKNLRRNTISPDQCPREGAVVDPVPSARGASGFQQCPPDRIINRDLTDTFCSGMKLCRHIPAVPGDDLLFPAFRRSPGGWQSSQLFRTNRDEFIVLFQLSELFLRQGIVAAAVFAVLSNQAGGDQQFFHYPSMEASASS